MAATQFFYDRVSVYIDGNAYLPNGQIRSFSVQAIYNSKIQQSMTPNGYALGYTIGNRSFSFNWTELFPTQADYLNFRTYCQANPNTTFTIVPISLASNVPIAQSFTLTGIQPVNISIPAPSEGEAMTRDCGFIAITCSGL